MNTNTMTTRTKGYVLSKESQKIATNDEELVRQYKDGTPTQRQKIFTILHNKHHKYVASVVRKYVYGNEEEVKDIVQEVFLRLSKSLVEYHGESTFRSWLFTLIRYQTCTSIKEMIRFKERSKIEITDLNSIDKTTPDEVLLSLESEEVLWEAVETLSDLQKAAWTLHYMEGLSYTEIGKIYGCLRQTAQSRVWKANLGIKSYINLVAGKEVN